MYSFGYTNCKLNPILIDNITENIITNEFK